MMSIKLFTPQVRQEAEAFLQERCPQVLATIRTDQELLEAIGAIDTEKLIEMVVPICKETRAILAEERRGTRRCQRFETKKIGKYSRN